MRNNELEGLIDARLAETQHVDLANIVIESEPEIIPSPAEAFQTVQDLVNQLENIDDLEEKLLVAAESLAFNSFTKGGIYRDKLEKLQKQISAVQNNKRMLLVAVTQGESILVKARAVEANKVAKEEAEEARVVASDMVTIGSEMDEGLVAFLQGYREFREKASSLNNLGYSVYIV
jgi:hypothetical protein